MTVVHSNEVPVAFLGDIHGALPPLPDARIVFLAGDILPDGGIQRQSEWVVKYLNPWLENAKTLGVHIVAVSGNHDHLFAVSPQIPLTLPWFYLRDSFVNVLGVSVYGFPWVPSDCDNDWDATCFTIDEKAKRLPEDCDIWLMHAAPHGIGDLMDHDCSRNSWRCGSLSVLHAIHDKKPKLVVFGHNHQSRGSWKVGDSFLVNATTGYNGSHDGRGFHGKKPFSWWNMSWMDAPLFLSGEEFIFEKIPGLYIYDRVGIGKRRLRLGECGHVLDGAARCERQWRVRTTARYGGPTLIVSGDQEDCMYLKLDSDGVFRGRWEKYERCNVELTRISA